MISNKTKVQTDLSLFLGIITVLIIIGLIFIYSSSSVYALERFGSPHYFVKKQFIALILGLAGMVIAAKIPLDLIKHFSPLFFMGSLLLTALTMIPRFAVQIHGSNRWLNLGLIAFQPSEILKWALLIYLAYFLAKKEKQSSSFIHSFLPFIIILGLTSAVLLKQPDFGLTVTLATTACLMLFVAHFQTRALMVMVLAMLPVAMGLVVLKPYRLKRILIFLNPWSDPKGAGFQVIQSLIAIGSGSWTGLGIANSKQKFFYLPMQHTDFIFSIIAEETGLLGSAVIILLFVLLLYIGMRIAGRLEDPFSFFTMFGFIILISLQAIINLAVATGLAPTKGTGLPFVSYGNTALLTTLVMLGVIINIVRENK